MDVEKTMEFILGQQALFASNMASLTARMDRSMAQLSQSTASVWSLDERVQALARGTDFLIESREANRQAWQAQIEATNRRHRERMEKLDARIRIVNDLIQKRNSP